MTLHKFVYEYEGNTFLGERYPQQKMVIKSDCYDLDTEEILNLFNFYIVTCGYAEKSFYDACTEAAETNPYKRSGNGYKVGETQWREEISPTYEDTLRHNVNKIKERDEFRDMLS